MTIPLIEDVKRSARANVCDLAATLCRRSTVGAVRSMADFAEQEVILSEGPRKGKRFDLDFQPYARAWFAGIDSGKYQRHFCTGKVQDGKTLLGLIIPVMYYLFEMEETVILGAPRLPIAKEKWERDIKPAIQRTKFRGLLPIKGAGSRDGEFERIRFRNGAHLIFMTAGGGDARRSSSTSRVVIITEIDKMDAAKEASRETDPVKQMEARTRAFGRNRVVIGECTVSIPEGRIWQEYIKGTQHRITLPCHACGDYVTPEGDHLSGWQEADNPVDAAEMTVLACPNCGATWTEEQRLLANKKLVSVPMGCSIDKEGNIRGEPKKADTFSFRWNAFNSSLMEVGDVGRELWEADRSDDDPDRATREVNQFYLVKPQEAPRVVDNQITIEGVLRREVQGIERGIIPNGSTIVTVGADISKNIIHWTAVAFSDQFATVIDYGGIDTYVDNIGDERGISTALREFRSMCEFGFPLQSDPATRWSPDTVFIDSGWQGTGREKIVYSFIHEDETDPSIYFPVKGFGATQYKPKEMISGNVGFIGDHYHIGYIQSERIHLVQINADIWKGRLHGRLCQPLDAPGALRLFRHPKPRGHKLYGKHIISEKRVEEFVAGKGMVAKFVKDSGQNHWLDTTSYAMVAGDYAGAFQEDQPQESDSPDYPVGVVPGYTRPNGRPFIPRR